MLTLAELSHFGLFTLIFVGMAFVIVLLSGIFWYSWHETKRKQDFKLQRERETTHRELAAYVAEGSISPEDAEKLIRAMGEVDEQARLAKGELLRIGEKEDGSVAVSVGGVAVV